MLHTIQSVDAQNEHTLTIVYEDGVAVEVDFAPLIEQGGVFAPLADPSFFAKVEIGERGRFLTWPGDLEFCADALRINQNAMATT